MKTTFAIAVTTWRQATRQPAYWIVLALGGAVIATSPLFALFGLGEEEQLIADLGLPTILLCGIFVAVSSCWTTVTAELEDGRALALLATPTRPIMYVLGKYLGVVAALAVVAASLTVVLLATLRGVSRQPPRWFWAILMVSCVPVVVGLVARRRGGGSGAETRAVLGLAVGGVVLFAASALVGPVECCGSAEHAHGVGGWRWDVAAAGVLEWLELLVIAAIAVALSVRLPLVGTASVMAATVVVGSLSNAMFFWLRSRVGVVAWVARVAVPNLDNFHVASAVARGRALPAEAFVWAGAYGVLYAGAMLAVAAWLFSGREVK